MKYDPRITLCELEKFWVLHALHACKFNKMEAARMLGITCKTLYNMLHRWGVPLDKSEQASWFFAQYPHMNVPITIEIWANSPALPRGHNG